MKITKCESCGTPIELRPGTNEDPMPKWWQRTSIREIAEDIFAADPYSPALKSDGADLHIQLPPEAEVWIEHTPDKCRSRREVSSS